MALAEIIIPDCEDQRALLTRELRLDQAQLAMEIRSKLAPELHRSLGIRLLIEDTLDFFLSAIASGFWDDLFDWIDDKRYTVAAGDISRDIVVYIARFIESLCESRLTGFSTLLGDIRIRMAQFHRILFKKRNIGWRQYEEEAHDPIDVAVDDIITSLDTKDLSTGEHSRAVSAWCTRLAMKLGLSEEMIIKVTRGGLIHDIGKTTTPLEVLQAPRKLTDEEWKIMAHHVIAGWEMLQDLPVLSSFESIVRNHHEKYEGGGYPDNLDREDIPLSTRIVTVADCFNAMIGRRPYRKPLSPMTAIEELRRHRSTQFDPDVTDAMTEIVYDMARKAGLAVPEGFVRTRRALIES